MENDSRWRMAVAGEWQSLENGRHWRMENGRRWSGSRWSPEKSRGYRASDPALALATTFLQGLEKRRAGVLASNSIPWDTILYHKD